MNNNYHIAYRNSNQHDSGGVNQDLDSESVNQA